MTFFGKMSAGAFGEVNWLLAKSFNTTKTKDLPSNLEPISTGHECDLIINSPSSRSCLTDSVIGKRTENSYVRPDGLTVTVGGGYTPMPPIPGKPSTLVLSYYNKSNSEFNIYTEEYNSANLTKQTTWDPVMYRATTSYVYNPKNLKVIKAPDGQPFSYTPGLFSYSQNGRWAVGTTRSYPDGSVGQLVLFDMDNPLSPSRGITRTINLSFYPHSSIKSSNLAVSNDGRYVAFNGYEQGNYAKPTLRIYDTTTCVNQYRLGNSYPNNCEYNDVWNGRFRVPEGRYFSTYTSTIPPQSNVEFPRHLRFETDNSLSFQGVYGRVSSTMFSVGEFRVSTDEYSKAPLSLLVMGDSYISGEGANYYRSGTDTRDNKCHNSWLAYGYQRGWSYFPGDRVKSVACSGAVIDDIDAGLWANDIDGARENYNGQTKLEIIWRKRDADLIKNNFIPGYANQMIFQKENSPRNTLLSIGGNDIGFDDILKSCITNVASSTCYETYQDRLQLMKTINEKYSSLKKLYERTMEEGGGKLYVVGYPQVAKPDGACGSNVRLDNEEIKLSNYLITYINKVIKRATSDAGAFYVDTENALNGYRLCEAPKNKQAVNGLTAGNDKAVTFYIKSNISTLGPKIPVKVGIGNESYHPTAYGHKLLGASIVSKTANFTSEMPKKTYLGQPTVVFGDPLLTSVPKNQSTENSKLMWQRSKQGEVPVLLKGTKYRLNQKDTLLPGSNVKLVAHSTPTILYEGNNLDTEIEIPLNLEAGFHRLDVYGTGIGGDEVDIRQTIYVAEAADDIDGDGTPNESDQCVLVAQSGLDEDQDGTDDACDGNIIDPAIAPEGVEIIPQENPVPNEPEQTVPEDSQDILLPVIKTTLAPEESSANEAEEGASNPDNVTPPINTDGKKDAGIVAQILPIGNSNRVNNIQIDFHLSTLQKGQNVIVQNIQGAVLGEHSTPKLTELISKNAIKPDLKSLSRGTPSTKAPNYIYVLALMVLASSLYFAYKKSRRS